MQEKCILLLDKGTNIVTKGEQAVLKFLEENGQLTISTEKSKPRKSRQNTANYFSYSGSHIEDFIANVTATCHIRCDIVRVTGMPAKGGPLHKAVSEGADAYTGKGGGILRWKNCYM